MAYSIDLAFHFSKQATDWPSFKFSTFKWLTWTCASLRALATPSVTHDDSAERGVALPRVRAVRDTPTFWTGKANNGPTYQSDRYKNHDMVLKIKSIFGLQSLLCSHWEECPHAKPLMQWGYPGMQKPIIRVFILTWHFQMCPHWGGNYIVYALQSV